MKKRITLLVFTILAICTLNVKAQEEEKKSSFTAGADFYSNYVWRGSVLGTGPAFQPSVKFTSGVFTAGVWGSFDASGYAEADPYTSFAFKNGLSLGLTDYYYPRAGGSFTADSTNAVEINVGYAIGSLSLSANYILNEASVAASAGKDKYFQASYAFKNCSLFVGAGDGWHTSDGKFSVCNIGLGTGKVIKITDNFSVPVTGQVIFNPEKNQMFMVVGFSL
jgi:hypothetical protein